MATKETKQFVRGITNPKKNFEEKMREAEEGPEYDPKKGRDAGDLPGPNTMTQAQFSGYDKAKKK